ncbi:MAG: bidirectional hydrogenase complex protein HoxE [Isosphaeraceae bacterium]|nr:bidirectional hydrogenase complex protein HoxE [Isosphaeraceae bacterium]
MNAPPRAPLPPDGRSGRTSNAAEPHPSGDPRFKLLDAALKRHRRRQDALIEVLQSAQELFGKLDADVLIYVARGLELPPSRVYGTATFYHMFTFTAKGEHTCTVCTGTACYVKGAEQILAALEDATGIAAGRTRPDGRISLETARCLGSCGIAPVVVFDGGVEGKVSAAAAVEHVKGWLADGTE